jgi:glycerophosphoryl diester phosphodiesterase
MYIVGHRGARGLAPENTIKAIQKGIEHHADELEIDLRVTKDSVVILQHDEYLTDPNGERHEISANSYEFLLQRKSDLTSLEQALEFAGPKQALYLEVKPEADTDPIIKLVGDFYAHGWKNLKLASFSQARLIELHKALPEVPVIVIEKWSGVRASKRAKELNTKYVCMNERWLWWGFIRPVTKRGWKLYCYTLNDPKKAARFMRYGLYGLVTDYPDLFDKL